MCPPVPQARALDEILQIGRLFGAQRPARRVVHDLRTRIDDLRAKGRPRHPLVLTRAGTSQEPLRPANGLIAELVRLAGGTDVVPTTGDARTAVRRSDAELFLVVGHASEEVARPASDLAAGGWVPLLGSPPAQPATAEVSLPT